VYFTARSVSAEEGGEDGVKYHKQKTLFVVFNYLNHCKMMGKMASIICKNGAHNPEKRCT